MVSDFIVNVDETDFEYEVLQYSMRVPVLVYFWATWCIPCRVLDPKLEDLARQGEGSFRLAKVDVDESTRLAKQYKIRNVPAVKAFVDGNVVGEFSGVLSDDGLRDFVRRIAPAPDDLIFSKGMNLLALGDYSEAEDAFRAYLSYQPNHPGALLGLIRVLLFRGEGHESAILLRNFPASSLYQTAQQLMPVARVFTERFSEGSAEDNILEAAFLNSVRLARRGNILAAMDGFLDILRKDKHYRDDQVKDVFVGLLALIGESHPDARSYRQELSSVLF